jgi:hypothetical protein
MYIDNTGKYQDWLDTNYPRLVPAIGPAETFEGELLRAVDTMYFSYFNNDKPIAIINVSSKFLLTHFSQLCDAATNDLMLLYRESSLGEFCSIELLEDSLERVYDLVCEYIIGCDSYTTNTTDFCKSRRSINELYFNEV